MILSLTIYMCCGAIVGLMAGLLGLGGGLIIVPILIYVFPTLGVKAQYIQQLALGTSLASIIFTSLSSAIAHHKMGNVHWDIFKNITPGILLGTFIGGLIASHMPTLFLKIFFICFLFIITAQMLSNYKPPANRNIPGKIGTAIVGSIIGLISSFVGIGGGTISLTYMYYCNIQMHHAIGTSAAIGFPIALAGATGYALGGYNKPDLPEFTIGFVHLQALFGITVTSMLVAPIGAKISNSIPVKKLKRGFAYFLLIMAIKMIWDIIY